MNMDYKTKKYLKHYLAILRHELPTFLFSMLGIIIYTLGVIVFTLQYNFPDTGVMGLSLLSKYSFGFSASVANLVLNFAIFIWGGRELPKRFIIYSVINVFAISLILHIFGSVEVPHVNDFFLVSVAGGIVKGFGLGILFRVGSSSGGIDIVAAVMRKRYGVEIGRYSFYINSFIIAAALPVVGFEKVLFGAVAGYVSGKTLDSVLSSFDKRRLVFVVTQPETKSEIISFISGTLRRGSTVFQSTGGFTGVERVTLMCLLTPRQTMDLKRYLSVNHKRAFMIVSEASEVLGNGFKRWGTVQ